jgi:hypothetical protein
MNRVSFSSILHCCQLLWQLLSCKWMQHSKLLLEVLSAGNPSCCITWLFFASRIIFYDCQNEGFIRSIPLTECRTRTREFSFTWLKIPFHLLSSTDGLSTLLLHIYHIFLNYFLFIFNVIF